MPDVSTAFPEIENLGPQELEATRRGIILEMQTKYRGYEDPLVPVELLQKLSFVTSMLRRKNAGPPKATRAPKATRKGAKATTDDLLI